MKAKPTVEIKVRHALIDRSLSVEDLCRAIKQRPSYVYKLMRGERSGVRGRRAAYIRKRIAKYLKIPYADIWGPDGAKK